MNEVYLITLSGLTASDGSLIESGAIVKISTMFELNQNIRVYLKIYRNLEIFKNGYSPIQVNGNILPDNIYFTDLINDYYSLTIEQLYTIVCNWLNDFYKSEMFKIENNIIEEPINN